MAEIATNVLHNVGNVLNSVNVSASLLVERVGNARPSGLARVAALLKDRSADLAVSLSAYSDGRGCGATFILELPREAPIA